ncbi:MAG: hypothetical protein GKR89_19420 [Candidatus Latescibacteria bacterium]|nr:hypothetical protein [Candidatus Latescibacterota bacterium]
MWTRTVLLGTLILGEWLCRGNTYIVGRRNLTSQVLHNSLLYILILGLLLIGLATGLPHILQGLKPDIHSTPWVLLAILTLLSVAQAGGLGILLGQDRIRWHALAPVVFIGVYTGGNFLALVVMDTGLDGVLMAWLAATLLATALVYTALRGNGDWPVRVDLLTFRQVLQIGRPGGFSAVLVYALFTSTVFLVNWLVPDEEARGVYNMAVVLFTIIQRLPNEAGIVLLPKVLKGRDDDQLMSLRIAQATILFSLAIVLGIFVCGRFGLELAFGEKYEAAYQPLVYLLPGLVFSGFGSVLNTRLAGQGYPPVTIWMPGLGLVANVACSFWLIPKMGLPGAGLATSLAYAVWALGITAYYLKLAGLSWRVFLGLSVR